MSTPFFRHLIRSNTSPSFIINNIIASTTSAACASCAHNHQFICPEVSNSSTGVDSTPLSSQPNAIESIHLRSAIRLGEAIKVMRADWLTKHKHTTPLNVAAIETMRFIRGHTNRVRLTPGPIGKCPQLSRG